MAHAVDASLHGLRVQLEYTVASRLLHRGHRYRIEVELPATGGRFVRTGAVRDISERAVGFEILEPLPALVLDEPSAGHEPRRRRSKTRSDSMPNPAP